MIATPEYSDRHWRFIWESLEDLQDQLKPYQAEIQIVQSEVVDLLEQLNRRYSIQSIYSHQETGIKITFDRDRAVKEFCRKSGVEWKEYVHDGVKRGLSHRTHFQDQVTRFFNSKAVQPKLDELQGISIPQELKGSPIPDRWKQYRPPFQKGGERMAWRYLNTFLSRAENYSKFLSKPLLSRKSCSRISPYIAWGNISLRELVHWTHQPGLSHHLARNLTRFRERLWWRVHYLQKLEGEWQMEFEPINRAFHALDRGLNEAHFEAWASGQTGIPMVDASMRCLEATGWINFRMRAMLVTFTSFALWMDWRPVAQKLAQVFLDYEPGIHYPQHQMQAGLTGYHTMRIFNPLYQGEQHDVDGAFVHQWVPELKEIPAPYCHYPWKLTELEKQWSPVKLGKHYPYPIVDYEQAVRENKDRYWAIRHSREVQENLPAIWNRHCIPKDIARYRKELEVKNRE